MEQWQRVGKAAEFRSGRPRSVRVGERRIAVFRLGKEWFALEDVCPHMRARLSEGAVRSGIVTCGWHGWRFDLRSGSCLTKPWARVRTCPVRVMEGEVWLGPPSAESPPPAATDSEPSGSKPV